MPDTLGAFVRGCPRCEAAGDPCAIHLAARLQVLYGIDTPVGHDDPEPVADAETIAAPELHAGVVRMWAWWVRESEYDAIKRRRQSVAVRPASTGGIALVEDQVVAVAKYTSGGKTTAEWVNRIITHVLPRATGLAPGFVVVTLAPLSRAEQEAYGADLRELARTLASQRVEVLAR